MHNKLHFIKMCLDLALSWLEGQDIIVETRYKAEIPTTKTDTKATKNCLET